MSEANVKYETPPVSTETPRQRAFGLVKSTVYLAIALALAIASVLGVLNPVIGP